MLKANKEKWTMATASKLLLNEDLGGLVAAGEVLSILKQKQTQSARWS